jgi:hypothetical protein
MSETTTRFVESHKKMRAVHAMTPEVESEKVMVFAPDFRLSDFCDTINIPSDSAKIQQEAIFDIPADLRLI